MQREANEMQDTVDPKTLVYDWNEKDRRGPLLKKKPRFVDETIRDGLQSPSVREIGRASCRERV